LKPENGVWLHVDQFTFTFADNIAGTLADATMPNITKSKILGVTLASGINYARKQNDKILYSTNIKSMIEFMQIPGAEITGQGSDGVSTWVSLIINNIEPLVLKAENDDQLSFTISEDLSGLLYFRITAGCRVEQRPNGSFNKCD
jgi:hypothetical protein